MNRLDYGSVVLTGILELFGILYAPFALATTDTHDIASSNTTAELADNGDNEFSDGNGAVLQSVFVTARKRTEDLEQVPISVSSVSGRELEQNANYSIQELADKVPNLLIAPSNVRQTSISIRGLGKNSANDGLETSVGVYVDGVYLGQPGETAFDLFDLDHIEVLRGPQGTLFGKNNTGGVVSISTRKPDFTPELEVESIGGNYGTYEVHAAGNVPITDTLAVRMTAYDRNRDGFLDDLYNGTRFNGYDRQGARLQFLWQPNDALSARLVAERYQSSEYSGVSVLLNPMATYANGAVNTQTFAAYTAPLKFVPVYAPWAGNIDLNSARPVTTTQDNVSAQVTWHVGGYSIDSISAFRHYTFDAKNDIDGMPLDIVNFDGTTSDNKQVSEELRLSSPTGDRFDYVAGLYYFHQSIWTNSDTLFGSDYAAVAGDSGNTAAALEGVRQDVIGTPVTTSYAAFAQANYKVADSVTLTGGLRETRESKHATINHVVSGGADAATLSADDAALRAATVDTSATAASFTENALSWLGTVAFRVTEDSNAYVTAAKGFKSGGINVEDTTVPSIVAPETAYSYEAGLKNRLLDRRLLVNINVYWETVKNYQGNFQSPTLGNYIANVGDVRVHGAEFETEARPIESVRLGASAAYNEATYQNFNNAKCPTELLNVLKICDFSGRTLPFAPHWTGTASASYTHRLNDHLKTVVDGYVTFRSASNVNQSLSIYGTQAAYTVANFQTSVASLDDRYALAFWVKNAFDTQFLTAVGNTYSSRSFTAALGDPRTFGATLRVSFK
jgi:iron complex outermembrane recepter protein